MQVRRTFWGVLFVLLGATLGAILTRSGVYYRLIYLSILLIIVSWIWARLSVINTQVDRTTRGLRQQLGSVFEEQFTVTNQFPLTKPWIEVEDASGLAASRSMRVLSWLRAQSSRNYSNYTLLSRRGEYALTPTFLFSGDPFGLFAYKKTLCSNDRLMVLPHLYDIQKFPVPSGNLPGGAAVRRRTPEVEPPRAASVREYAPGDPLSRIHWPTTARRDRWMVKEFEQDPQSDVWILLDAHDEAHIDSEEGVIQDLDQMHLWWLHRTEYKLPKDTFEYAASIAGSIARYFSRSGQVVGFACAGNRRIVLSSERGERQLNKILETLALLQPDGRMPLASLIEIQAANIPRGSTVIIITSSVHKSVISGISSLIRRRLNPIVVLIDPASFGKYYGVETIVGGFQSWKIPYVIVQYGQDIKLALEKGFPGV